MSAQQTAGTFVQSGVPSDFAKRRTARTRPASNSAQHLPPAPDGAGLSFHIACTGSLNHRTELVVHPDWHVTGPHDLEAERVARALGGEMSCAEFADRDLRAYRYALDLSSGAIDVDVFRVAESGVRYGNLDVDGCARCGFHDAGLSLVRHELDPSHLGRLFGIGRWRSITVLKVLERTWLSGPKLPEWPFSPRRI